MSKVTIEELIEYFELGKGCQEVYYNKKTHQRIYYTEDGDQIELRDDEQPENHRELESDEFEAMIDLEEDWVSFPNQYEIDDWTFMEDFCSSLKDEDNKIDCINAIHGKGSFRKFKDLMTRLGKLNVWYDFLEEEYRNIAKMWCEKNGIECDE